MWRSAVRVRVAWTVFLCAGTLAGADPATFSLSTRTLQPYTRTYLGNGYFSLVSSQLATKPSESYMIRVYDHYVDDVPRIGRLPAWNEVDFHNGAGWLNDVQASPGVVRNYSQTLDMYNGVLETSYEWMDQGRMSSIRVHAFVSRSNQHLGVIKFSVTPAFSGPVKILLPIRPWEAPKRLPLAKMEKLVPDAQGNRPFTGYPGHMVVKERKAEVDSSGGLLRVVSRAEGSDTSVAQVVALTWPSGLGGFSATAEPSADLAGVRIGFQAESGRTYEFVKFAGMTGSFETPSYVQSAADVAAAARTRGYAAALKDHSAAWHDLWQTDIEVDDPELQTAIHSTMFYLLSSVREGTEFNIPPMGLSSRAYNGHIFWDSDMFMYPQLLVTHPGLAKSLATFRCRTLGAAKTNAGLRGYKGAMYPWEADETGMESTPRFAWQNALGENHVTAFVAQGQWLYYLATGDKDYLRACAYPVLKETADYWISRATYNPEKDRYEIRNVVSANEGSIGSNNDVVTNVGARRNLELAIAASKLLGKPENPEWTKVHRKMFIPFDPKLDFYPEYEGAPPWKGGIGHVTPLIIYPFEFPATVQAKRNTLEYALKSNTDIKGGAFLLPTIYPIVAAETGEQALVDDAFRRSYKSYLRPPFNVLNETDERLQHESVNFITGTGWLQPFLYGFTGLRLAEDGLVARYRPILPSGISKLRLKNLTVRGRKFDIVVEGGNLSRVEK